MKRYSAGARQAFRAMCMVMLAAGLLGGCSPRQPAATGNGVKTAPLLADVDLDYLATQNPDWRMVAQTDKALMVYRSALASGMPVEHLPAMTDVYAQPLSALTVGPADNAVVDQMDSRLAQASAQRSEALKARLAASDNQALSQETEQVETDEKSRIAARRRDILNQGATTVSQIASGDWSKRLVLNIQIDALQRDRTSGTARPEIWAAKIKAAEDQLDALNAGQAQQMASSATQSGALVDRASAQEKATSQTQIEQFKTAQAASTALKLKNHADLLALRRREVIESAASFDGEMVQALEDARRAAPAVSLQTLGATGEAANVNPASQADWKARLQQTIDYLTAQRQRQVTLVREETRRAALGIARRDNFVIVDWQPSKGRHDLTPHVLAKLRGEGWQD